MKIIFVIVVAVVEESYKRIWENAHFIEMVYNVISILISKIQISLEELTHYTLQTML